MNDTDYSSNGSDFDVAIADVSTDNRGFGTTLTIPGLDYSTVDDGGGSLGNGFSEEATDYGTAANPTGALNLDAQTIGTNATAGGTLIASTGDTQPISSGQYGLSDFAQSLALALGDTTKQIVTTAGQVASNSVNTAGQKAVTKITSSQKTSVANTPAPAATGMKLTPTTMLVIAAVVVGFVFYQAKQRSAA